MLETSHHGACLTNFAQEKLSAMDADGLDPSIELNDSAEVWW